MYENIQYLFLVFIQLYGMSIRVYM